MEHIIATRETNELVELVIAAQEKGLSGEHGTWLEFLKFCDPTRDYFNDPRNRKAETLIQFLTSIIKTDDSRKLALLMNPSRPLVRRYSCNHPKETAEQRLVRKTLTHEEYPFDFLIPYKSKDWVLTGIIGSPIVDPLNDLAAEISYSFRSRMPYAKSIAITDMIALCCEKVLCQDNTEAAVRVAAVDRNLKVILDVLVKPNEPVINFRTSITGLDCFALHLSNATPLSDIQEKLLELFPTETIMVGHLLNKDLKALKMDHARVIDTSLLFKYDFSAAAGIVGKLPRPF
ncbi:small RNA degrading nuclease 2 [Raphanus sativus]|uniref:Small RNA degrading nuclease 2 n=1 Tax=Raphanus sativus TaxID=3726 RepID=A0A9W3CKC5_RAPSA|nr:small RNA degrading nuclease 2 [Raphanus sativus]XP_056852067.1 small RNA degrading nuclease 2 [Raphanus sativus]